MHGNGQVSSVQLFHTMAISSFLCFCLRAKKPSSNNFHHWAFTIIHFIFFPVFFINIFTRLYGKDNNTQIHEKPSASWKTYGNHACTSVVSIYTEPDKKKD